jgi:hypothetical protein
MKVYGLRVRDFGLEFETQKERQAAIRALTTASTVLIRDSEVKYRGSVDGFGTYTRDNDKVVTHCFECNAEFPQDICFKRSYVKSDWNREWAHVAHYICNGCLADWAIKKQVHDNEIAQAEAEEAASE